MVLKKMLFIALLGIISQSSLTQAQCSNYYRVFAVDSCDNIATAFGTTVANLLTLNPGMNCTILPVNQLICVPTVNNGLCTQFYTVRAGDSCTSIAALYGTTVSFLQAVNSNLNCSAATLTTNTIICVSSSSVATTTGTSSTTTCINYYRVYPVDTCDNIAAAYTTTVANLLLLNPGLNCQALPFLQLICVPLVNGLSTQCSNYYRIYAVDSCVDISTAFNITTAALLTLNPGLNCNSLPIGQYICVPSVNVNFFALSTLPAITTTTGTTIHVPSCQAYYVLNVGDTCQNILNNYGISQTMLQILNPNLNCNSLQYGTVICVPPSVQTCTCTYTVKSGDVCYTIALQNGLSLTQFYSLNPGLNCFNLNMGQNVCIRGASFYQTTTTSTTTHAPSFYNNVNSFTCGQYYTARHGDTCSSIATYFGMSLATLYSLNPHANCQNLALQTTPLCVVSNSLCSFMYVVQSSDTCYSLALKHRIELSRFTAKYNCNNLIVGQSLCL
jgi:LysM repeat protein